MERAKFRSENAADDVHFPQRKIFPLPILEPVFAEKENGPVKKLKLPMITFSSKSRSITITVPNPIRDEWIVYPDNI